MSDPFIAQITMFGGNFAPRGWAFCSGQLLPISQNAALFSILGTTYGGDGRTTFGLPDLRGRSPMHAGSGPGQPTIQLGQKGGAADTTLNITNMPNHSHTATLHAENKKGDSGNPTNQLLARTGVDTTDFSAPDPTANVAMHPESIVVGNTGLGQSFNNYHPFQAVNFIIALQGTFPSRN